MGEEEVREEVQASQEPMATDDDLGHLHPVGQGLHLQLRQPLGGLYHVEPAVHPLRPALGGACHPTLGRLYLAVEE